MKHRTRWMRNSKACALTVPRNGQADPADGSLCAGSWSVRLLVLLGSRLCHLQQAQRGDRSRDRARARDSTHLRAALRRRDDPQRHRLHRRRAQDRAGVQSLGRVAWIGVEKGDQVNEGQVLVRLEDEEFRARVTAGAGPVGFAQSAARRARKRLAPRRDRAQPGRSRTGARRPGERPRDARTARARWSIKASCRRQSLDDAQARYDAQVAQIRVLREELMAGPHRPAPAKRSTPCAPGQTGRRLARLRADPVRQHRHSLRRSPARSSSATSSAASSSPPALSATAAPKATSSRSPTSTTCRSSSTSARTISPSSGRSQPCHRHDRRLSGSQVQGRDRPRSRPKRTARRRPCR